MVSEARKHSLEFEIHKKIRGGCRIPVSGPAEGCSGKYRFA